MLIFFMFISPSAPSPSKQKRAPKTEPLQNWFPLLNAFIHRGPNWLSLGQSQGWTGPGGAFQEAFYRVAASSLILLYWNPARQKMTAPCPHYQNGSKHVYTQYSCELFTTELLSRISPSAFLDQNLISLYKTEENHRFDLLKLFKPDTFIQVLRSNKPERR